MYRNRSEGVDESTKFIRRIGFPGTLASRCTYALRIILSAVSTGARRATRVISGVGIVLILTSGMSGPDSYSLMSGA